MKKIIIDETVSYDCGLISAAILYWLKGEYDKMDETEKNTISKR